MREERKSRTVTSGTAGHDCARRPTPRPHGACRLVPERKVVQRASRGVAGSEAPLSPTRAGVAGELSGTGRELPLSPEPAQSSLPNVTRQWRHEWPAPPVMLSTG